MIKEAIDYLAKLQTPKNLVTTEVGGVNYRVSPDGTLGTAIIKPDLRPKLALLSMCTLTGFVEAFLALKEKDAAIHIVSPTEVSLIDVKTEKEFGTRNTYASASHVNDTPFEFGKYYEPEAFLLAFRASFLYNENAILVQKLCSTVTSGQAVSVADDGVSQEIVATIGTVTKSKIQLPAEGVPLIPWRTFREANPVESKFLLRMKGVKDSLPAIALFEIDAKWKNDTIASVEKYLRGKLPDAVIIA